MERNNMYKNGIQWFDGKKYALCRRRLKTYVQAQRFEFWKSIVDGYKEPTIPPTNDNRTKLSLNNSKVKSSLMNGLCDSVYIKVMHCSSAKYIWEKLHNIYDGDAKVKEARLQTYKDQFE
jgi:hypothetical protein